MLTFLIITCLVFSGIGGAVSFGLIYMHLEKRQYYWSGAALMMLLINATVFIVNLLRLFKLI